MLAHEKKGILIFLFMGLARICDRELFFIVIPGSLISKCRGEIIHGQRAV